MRLKNIKLAGFKSFVDPTNIPLQTNLTAVVGPNGCGKSNIVDAIRWVIGESSAKQLRGESLTDVIFNGTVHRKPVGQAAIELIFDNTDGTLGGEYASFGEISVRRELTRDGQSQFYLNNTRCRRKDVMDVFLGTGLGPRSYSIIEQGMISQLIEAKPEEIRVYLEEAAGISKYKERRRETENRIQHTRENLARLNDVREEIDKQLAHLKRQANAAERFKTLKQEQRLLKAQLHVLQCQLLDQELVKQHNTIQAQEVQIEAKVADQRRIDLDIEKTRLQHSELNDVFNEVQGRYYKLGSEVTRHEQQIQYIHEREKQLESDLIQLETAYNEAQQNLTDDQAQIEESTAELMHLEPQLETKRQEAEQLLEQLAEVEELLADKQNELEMFDRQAADVFRQVDVDQARLHQLTQRIQSVQQRRERILSQQASSSSSDSLQEEILALTAKSDSLKEIMDTLHDKLNEIDQAITSHRQELNQLQQKRDSSIKELHSIESRKASLEALQQAALGKTNENTLAWLKAHQLDEKPRLAEDLQVDSKWSAAVEVVLEGFLEAVCVDQLDTMTDKVMSFEKGQLVLIEQKPAYSSQSSRLTSLETKVSNTNKCGGLLRNVYIAENVAEARANVDHLAAHESIITPEAIWFGPNWIRINRQTHETAGVLQRNQELTQLTEQCEQQQGLIEEIEDQLQELRQKLNDFEVQRNQVQQQSRDHSNQYSETHAQARAKQAQFEQVSQRDAAARQELSELNLQFEQLQNEQLQIEEGLQEKIQQKSANEQQRSQLATQRDQMRNNIQQLRVTAQDQKRTADEYLVRVNSTRSQLHMLQQNIVRSEKQLEQLQERCETLKVQKQQAQEPLDELQQILAELLEQRLSVERELQQVREQVQSLEHHLRELEKSRSQLEETIYRLRSEIEQFRVDHRAMQVHKENHLEQIQQAQYTYEELRAELPAEAAIDVWQKNVEQVETRIQRLGPINLAAIEEYQQLDERKTYLDHQYNDLTEALGTLEDAIHKIDKESRTRLRETFDKVNNQFKIYFPKVFGGGNACLELTDDDVLTTGILIKAQPPGKRNASIHLLSGGEKALTAISLVFSLFQLNPAPFCVLDEVDAPLDDANVNRFCNLVKEMSEKVQFIFISHNKVTMEMAQQLAGITMNEPGVSRLVSVDIDQAMAMITN